ncbi:hypothetical protein L7F22_015860 [Adiantum nelumboides]|nr:hypothetical protein [Adiantum nelumboides]
MIWYFDSGTSRHITSRKDLFSSLDAAPAGKKVTCANNASYPIKGVGKILITISDGSDLCLPDVLYVPGIKKNLLSVSSLAKNGLRVIFEDDRCIVRDRENSYSLITTGTLENGLFVLDRYEKQIQACIAKTKTKAMQDAELWHARFGHVGYGSLMTLQRHNMVHDLSLLEMPPRHVCEGCVLGKMHRFAFSQDGSVRATRKLQLVHSDVCGPMRTPSVGNSLYFVTSIDDFSRFCWVYPLKAKSDVFAVFQHYVSMVENETGCKVQTLRTNRGGEYMSGAFKDFLGKKGIKHQCTMPYTPQQNGVAERKNRSLMEMARCMLKAKSLPHKLWMEAVACAAHVLNRCPTRALKTITPYESWYDRKPSVSYLRVFGCLAYAHIPQQLRGKLDDKAVKCIFVGYSSGSKGYRLYNPATNKIFESRDVIFAETTAQPMVAFDVPHMQTQDVFEGFLPSFVENQESQQVDNFDQSFDQHVTPHDVEEIVREEQEVLREERTLPKWVKKTLHDSKLDAPLPWKTREDAQEFLDNMEIACLVTGRDDDATRLRVFPLLMKAEAKVWFNTLLPANRGDWAGLRVLFLAKFGGGGETSESLWGKVCELRQGSLFEYNVYEVQFVELWERWVASLRLGEAAHDFLKKDRFVAGLCPPLREKVKGRFPVTWMDARDIARLKERKIRYPLQQREADQEEEGMAPVPPTNAPAAHRGQGNQDQQELLNRITHQLEDLSVHLVRGGRAPPPNQEQARGPRRQAQEYHCYNCGENGHGMYYCPHPRRIGNFRGPRNQVSPPRERQQQPPPFPIQQAPPVEILRPPVQPQPQQSPPPPPPIAPIPPLPVPENRAVNVISLDAKVKVEEEEKAAQVHRAAAPHGSSDGFICGKKEANQMHLVEKQKRLSWSLEKKPRQEDEDEIENIQADPLPSSPMSIPPAPPSSPKTHVPPPSSPRTPPSPKTLEPQKSPPTPAFSQQQQHSTKPPVVPPSSQLEDKQDDLLMDKAEAEVKQADTTKPRPAEKELQISLMQLEEPTQEEAYEEVKNFD